MATQFYEHFIPNLGCWPVAAVLCGVGSVIIYYVMAYSQMPQKNKKEIQEMLKAKVNQRLAHFQKVGEDLAKADEELKQKRIRITGLGFFELKDELQNGRITASDAVDAFRWKSFECQQKLNCVIEFLPEAIEIARDLDREFGDGQKQKPPMFGMPFSVKENFYLKGYDCTLGLAKFLGEPMKEDNTMVAHIRSLGAIPIVRTNVPQTCMSFTCSNTIYGTTGNPYDSSRTPGGSSGGEACLVAAGGVPFGTGSDVGGSLRIPAHFCGLTTIKPTSNRPKVLGGHPGIPGVTKVALSYSYFTKDVAALSFLFELTLVPSYFARVPQCVPLPFKADMVTSERTPLRIGYYDEDGWFPTVPACKRAVSEAKQILSNLGHQLVPFNIPNPEYAAGLISKVLFPDNGTFFVDLFKNEEVDEHLKMTKSLLSMPLSIRWLTSKILAPFDQKMSLGMNAYVRDLNDLRATNGDVDMYIKDFIDYWQSLSLDAVLGTVLPFPALPHDGPGKFSHGAFGTLLYNFLDFPAGVTRVSKVTKEDEDAMANYPNGQSVNSIQRHFHNMLREAMKNSIGLPLGVQVITLPYQEELCMKILRDIESNIH